MSKNKILLIKSHPFLKDSESYEDWRHWKFPNLLEVLEEFSSVRPYAPVLLQYLSNLQPRFYSISSSLLVHDSEIHLTVAVVEYKPAGMI